MHDYLARIIQTGSIGLTQAASPMSAPVSAEDVIDWRQSVLAEVSAVTERGAEESLSPMLYFLRYNPELRVSGNTPFK